MKLKITLFQKVVLSEYNCVRDVAVERVNKSSPVHHGLKTLLNHKFRLLQTSCLASILLPFARNCALTIKPEKRSNCRSSIKAITLLESSFRWWCFEKAHQNFTRDDRRHYAFAIFICTGIYRSHLLTRSFVVDV